MGKNDENREMKPGEGKECESCVYYHEPGLVNFKECCFPWFDYTEEDVVLMNCQEEAKEAADGGTTNTPGHATDKA